MITRLACGRRDRDRASTGAVTWWFGPPAGVPESFAWRAVGELTAPEAGRFTLSLVQTEGAVLLVDGEVVLDGRAAELPPGLDFFGAGRREQTVDLDLDTMVVADGNLVTAGAAFAHIDLALSLVRSISPDLAQHVAKLLLIDDRPSQAAFVAYEHLRHEDPVVIEFERIVRARLDEPFDVASVAHSIGISRRTLERRTRSTLNRVHCRAMN